jgi:uncharacterized protein Yka (UPF0111/DUF47 family)
LENEKNNRGDNITVGNVNGKGNIIGKNIHTGDINIDSINQAFQKNPSEYLKGLKTFSEKINEQLKNNQVAPEKVQQVQESVNDLQKEIEDIKPGTEDKIDPGKRLVIEGKTTTLVDKVIDAIPAASEVIATFTPLAPFSKLIRKGVEQIVDAVKKSRS